MTTDFFDETSVFITNQQNFGGCDLPSKNLDNFRMKHTNALLLVEENKILHLQVIRRLTHCNVSILTKVLIFGDEALHKNSLAATETVLT